MRNLLTIICYVSIVFVLFSCEKSESASFYEDYQSLEKSAEKYGQNVHYDDSVAMQMAIIASIYAENHDKTVGVFGGSLSCREESWYARYIWAKYLGLKIHTYGKNGYGFSRNQGSIQDQVDEAQIHDIYILWASTNDYTNNREIGEYSDYTELDNYDKTKLDTQCGGMNYCIQTLQTKNPDAKIYIFCSLPFFLYPGGYQRNTENRNKLGYTFYEYIEAQMQVAEYHKLKYLKQFDIPVLTLERSEDYYLEDKFHMTARGYANVGIYQLYFMSTERGLH